MANERFNEFPLCRRIILLLLAPIVMLASFVVLAAILIPCAIWNGLVSLLYWLRYKLFGVPIPPKYPFPPEDAS